jgi:hypothetical protein
MAGSGQDEYSRARILLGSAHLVLLGKRTMTLTNNWITPLR